MAPLAARALTADVTARLSVWFGPRGRVRAGADVARRGQRKAAGARRATSLAASQPQTEAAPRHGRRIGARRSCTSSGQPRPGALRAPLKT